MQARGGVAAVSDLAFVPDGDIFKGIKSGTASLVTDEIERFTKMAAHPGLLGRERSSTRHRPGR